MGQEKSLWTMEGNGIFLFVLLSYMELKAQRGRLKEYIGCNNLSADLFARRERGFVTREGRRKKEVIRTTCIESLEVCIDMFVGTIIRSDYYRLRVGKQQSRDM